MPLGAGQIVYEDDIDTIPARVVYKNPGGLTGRANNTLLADPDLAGLTLYPGLWDIKAVIFANAPSGTVTTTTPRLKTRWAFTGGWASSFRLCHGPGASNTASNADSNPVTTMRGFDADSQDALYNFGVGAAYTAILESAVIAVSATGDMSFMWAQSVTTPGTTINVLGGSYMKATLLRTP